MLSVLPTRLPEVLTLQPKVFGDERGFFMESWNERRFDQVIGRAVRFVQDNHSRSGLGVLRGMHYQVGQPQEKLVRVISGRVYDVAVDMRRSSATLGQWVGVELSADNQRQMWIPAGFAHGYLVLSQYADLVYKCSDYYAPEHERTLAWNDRHVGIQWPLASLAGPPSLSGKDQAAAAWSNCALFD